MKKFFNLICLMSSLSLIVNSLSLVYGATQPYAEIKFINGNSLYYVPNGGYIDPDTAELAAFEYNSGNIEKATYLINLAIEEQPQNPRLYNTRGLIMMAAGDNSSALSDFTEAINIKTDYATPYYNRAALYTDLGYYQKAIADYNTAIQLNYHGNGAYINRGFAKLDYMQDIDGAYKDFTIAIERGTDHEGPYYGRAVCNYKKQLYKEAIDDASQAISLESLNPDAYLIRGKAKIMLNDIISGLDDIKTAKEQFIQSDNIEKAQNAQDLYLYYADKEY